MERREPTASRAKVEDRNGQELNSWRSMQYAQGFGACFCWRLDWAGKTCGWLNGGCENALCGVIPTASVSC